MNIEKRAIIIAFMLMTGMLMTGCYYDKEELLYPDSYVNCNTIHAGFVDVKPIISGKCATAGCHNAGTSAGGVVLETYEQVKAKADRINQRAIVEKSMPQVAPLSAAEISVLKCWMNSGTPN